MKRPSVWPWTSHPPRTTAHPQIQTDVRLTFWSCICAIHQFLPEHPCPVYPIKNAIGHPTHPSPCQNLFWGNMLKEQANSLSHHGNSCNSYVTTTITIQWLLLLLVVPLIVKADLRKAKKRLAAAAAAQKTDHAWWIASDFKQEQGANTSRNTRLFSTRPTQVMALLPWITIR
jgi:hypothetical protein